MEIYKKLCALIVTGWLAFHTWEHFKPEPAAPSLEVTQIIIADPSGGPDIVVWKER